MAGLTVGLTGTVTASFGDPDNPLFTGVNSVSLNFVDPSDSSIELTGPALMPVTATVTDGLASWKDVGTWPGSQFVVKISATLLKLFSDATSIDAKSANDIVDALQGFGPSNQSVPIPLDFLFVFPVSVSLNLIYSVTIPDGAQVEMDQANVEIYDLTIDAGGYLEAGSQDFTIDTNLNNNGQLDIIAGQTTTVKEYLFNLGTINLDGSLVVSKELFNTGALNVQGTQILQSPTIDNFGGIITILDDSQAEINGLVTGGLVEAQSGGTVSVRNNGTIRYGTVQADAGGTVEIGYRGVLRDLTLAGTGSFKGIGNYVDDAGELQDVTIGSGVSFSAVLLTLGGTITNHGMLTLSSLAGVDGPVTLTGGGNLVVTGILGSADYYNLSRLNLSSDPDRLINVDNTISGTGNLQALDITNESGGTIGNSVSNQTLSIGSSGSILNKGLITASGGGAVTLYGSITK